MPDGWAGSYRHPQVEGEDVGIKQNIWDVAEQGVFKINLQLPS